MYTYILHITYIVCFSIYKENIHYVYNRIFILLYISVRIIFYITINFQIFQGDEVDENITEEMLGAASTLIREWAENLLGLKFPTLSALARHLVDNLCVDTRSLSAVCILCASGNSNTTTNKGFRDCYMF